MANNRQEYISNYARTLAGQLGIHTQQFLEYEFSAIRMMRAVKTRHWDAIRQNVAAQRDEVRGKLAAAGNGMSTESIFQMSWVHTDEPWLDEQWDGSMLITQIAATAVVCAIAQNIHSYLADIAESEEFLWDEYRKEVEF